MQLKQRVLVLVFSNLKDPMIKRLFMVCRLCRQTTQYTCINVMLMRHEENCPNNIPKASSQRPENSVWTLNVSLETL